MIKESVVWIEQTREQAITLAHDVGNDAEVHALHIRKGTFGLAEKPVGYLVYIPPKWVGLTNEEIYEIYEATEKLVGEHWDNGGTILMFPTTLYQAIEAKLKEKNT
jgi:hypothetical protein